MLCVTLDLRETGWKDVYWIHLAQNRDQREALVNMIMNLWVSYKAENILTS
jgi:hypothetical protein